ncbi:hypothetical protein QF028_001534 [Neobacillus sp. B4I6]
MLNVILIYYLDSDNTIECHPLKFSRLHLNMQLMCNRIHVMNSTINVVNKSVIPYRQFYRMVIFHRVNYTQVEFLRLMLVNNRLPYSFSVEPKISLHLCLFGLEISRSPFNFTSVTYRHINHLSIIIREQTFFM